MNALLERLTRLVKAPLMIDSTDPEVMELALAHCQGKSVLNSINLEDGRARFDRVAGLAAKWGAALVVGLIDESGMAVTLERKIEIARRSYGLLTEDLDVTPYDIWFDPLVFPCATGDEAYIGSAALTIEGVRQIKREFPEARTILGISNVSFGLPLAGREVLNSVFLYHCTRAGLDAAIVNTQALARYAELPPLEVELSERLLFLAPGDVAGSEEAIAAFTSHFRGRDVRKEGAPRANLPLEERLARAVVEGSKQGLIDDLDAALADDRWPEPLDIVNGPLMAGMAEVGRLFNDNQLIVAEVLQSAEVMKAAVDHLEPHMEKAGGASRGKVLLATVKGDVHDIGKNLVDIVLSNNGFEVINLGIKVPSEVLIQAFRDHHPDVIGLSGLLVKSAQQMVTTAQDLAAEGVDAPMLVGGAALSRRFTHQRIAPEYGATCTYASDAMHGLHLVERLVNAGARRELEAEIRALAEADAQAPAASSSSPVATASRRSADVRTDVKVPLPPDLDRHVETLDLEEVWTFVNRQMLLGKHLGIKGSVERLEAKRDPKLRKLEEQVRGVQDRIAGDPMEARAVWRFFRAEADGNGLRLLDENGGVAASWEMPRQQTREGLSLPDYVLEDDHVALFVTTAGVGVRELAEAWRLRGDYLRSHILAALALETAEAAAELLHTRLRAAWGFPDPADITLRDRLAARYRGKRYSFGYPACPDLSYQRALFAALSPEDIGVTLTDGDMMDPEASVSALVFHHPDARYFGV